jgi:hypothetical protein
MGQHFLIYLSEVKSARNMRNGSLVCYVVEGYVVIIVYRGEKRLLLHLVNIEGRELVL